MRSSPSTIKSAAADWIARRDAGLSRSESAELKAWLEADPRHREAFAHCDSVWGALDRPHKAGAADDLLDAVETCVRGRRRRQMAFAAAGLAIFMMVGFAWRSATSPASDSLQSRRSGTAIIVLPSRQVLPDSTVVELNSGAEIARDFRGRTRRVVLQKGEAHFQVAPDASRPFVVVVGNVEVRAVGTAFSVQRGHANVTVLVTEGQVAVEQKLINRDEGAETKASAARTPQFLPPPVPPDLSPSSPPLLLEAGNRTVVDLFPTDQVRREIEILPVAEVRERLAWRAPRLEFSGTPLSEAVALLNEQADKAAAAGQPALRYAIGDPEIAPMRVSGLFRVDNTESFVRLLKHGFGIEAEERDGSAEIVLRKSR